MKDQTGKRNHNYQHGKTGTPEHFAYIEARRRCKRNYAKYGTEFRFNSFEEFLAELGPRPTSEHSVDRINSKGHYEQGNLRWATKLEQTHNTRISRSAISAKGRLTLWIKRNVAAMPVWVAEVRPSLSGAA